MLASALFSLSGCRDTSFQALGFQPEHVRSVTVTQTPNDANGITGGSAVFSKPDELKPFLDHMLKARAQSYSKASPEFWITVALKSGGEVKLRMYANCIGPDERGSATVTAWCTDDRTLANFIEAAIAPK